VRFLWLQLIYVIYYLLFIVFAFEFIYTFLINYILLGQYLKIILSLNYKSILWMQAYI